MRGSLSKVSIYCFTVILGMFLLAFNQQSFGQDVNASLEGTVLDPNGAVVPSAKLILTNESNGAQLNFQTDPAGEYNFRNLTPGIYDLSVTAPSFETFVRKGIELAVNQNARIDVKLTLGNTSQTVTVSADASLIKVTSFSERYSLKYTFDVYNLTNTSSFDVPGNEVSQNANYNGFPTVAGSYTSGIAPTGQTCNSTAGQNSAEPNTGNYFYNCPTGIGVVTHTIGSARQIQMSLQLLF